MKKLFFLFVFITAFALSLSAQSSTAKISYITYNGGNLLIEKWSDGTEVPITKCTNRFLASDEVYYKRFYSESGYIYNLTFKSCLEGEYLSLIEKFDKYLTPVYVQFIQYEPKWLSFVSEIDSSIIKLNLSPLVLKDYQCQEAHADGNSIWETDDENPYDIQTINGKIVAVYNTITETWYNRLD